MSSNDDWILHEAQTQPRRLGRKEVSLTKTNIVFSEELGEQFQAKAVVFEFRADPRTIRIRPAGDDESGYKVSYRSISSRAFYADCNITERGRFLASVQDGAIVIPLQ